MIRLASRIEGMPTHTWQTGEVCPVRFRTSENHGGGDLLLEIYSIFTATSITTTLVERRVY